MVAGSLQRRPYRVGLLRAVSRSYRQRRRHSRSARILRASPPAPRRRFHGRRPTRLPAAEPASLHRASQDLSPSRRLQPPCTASPAQAVADRQRESAPVIVNPAPEFTWHQSLPVTFNDPAIVPFGGTETRALVFMDGSLYAGIGDQGDSSADTPLDAQVLRLDSPTSGWVEDQNFIPVVTNKNGTNKFGAVAQSRDGAFRSGFKQQPDHAGRRTYGWVLESP